MSARLLAGVVLILTVPAGAATPLPKSLAPGNSAALSNLLNCQKIGDSQARLACYDSNAKALADATASQSIVVLDREQVRKTKRSLFGFDIPTLNLFGGKPTGAEEAEAREITATARAASQNREGRWVITLDDGARWLQTDDNVVALPPHSGSKILIRRAALGSFFLKVDGQPGIKAQRVS